MTASESWFVRLEVASGWDWPAIVTAGVSAIVAIATGVLAFMTWKMARATAGMAKEAGRQAAATEDQASISADALQASIRPWLSRVTPSFADSHLLESAGTEEGRVHVRKTGATLEVELYLRNVGNGLAKIQPHEDHYIEGPGPNSSVDRRQGFATAAILRPGESTLLTYLVEGVDSTEFLDQKSSHGSLVICVPYADANGQQQVTARLTITRLVGGGEWGFKRIDYFHGLARGTPFDSVEFDAAAMHKKIVRRRG
jgi:hypothetical protein